MPNHQLSLQLIRHEVNNNVIPQRSTDGYINATELCKAGAARWNDYFENRKTKDYLAVVVTKTGIPVLDLIQQVTTTGVRSTWVHPKVAIHLGQWISPEFAYQVSEWVHDWMTGKGARAPYPSILPYHIRRHMMNQNSVPAGHFSILQEMTHILIAPLDAYGYELPEKLVPDISMGRFLCSHLRKMLGVDTDALPTYIHEYPDGRKVAAKAYPDEVLAEFRRIIREEWLPQRAAKYFQERSPAALPYLDKIILSLPKPPTTPAPLAGSVKKKAA